MAYGSRPRRRTRRSFARRRPVARRVRRMPYRKRTTGSRRPMTRRRILNFTSKKKQDNMLVASISSTGTVTQAATTVPSTGVTAVQEYVWCATARDRTTGSGGDPNATSLREADLVFMRGLKERITVATDSAMSWRWRRICFTKKGPLGLSVIPALETSNGWQRGMYQLSTADQVALNTSLFRGASGIDWSNPMIAKVDTQRVTIKSDVTRTLSSGNTLGKFFRFNHWYPMNHNLMYSNDEVGEGTSTDAFSTTGKAGMGDYYIVDLFQSIGASVNDNLRFEPQATLYWHEK